MFKKLVLTDFSEDELSNDLWKRMESCAEELVRRSREDPGFMQELEGADAVILRLGMAADQVFQDTAPSLRYIGMFGTGYGRIDIGHARSRGIVVTNVADYSTQSVAEFVLGMAIVEARNLADELERAATGDVQETEFEGREVASLKIGVIGAGNIGQRTIKLFSGLGAEVRYWSRRRRPELEQDRVAYQDLPELLAENQVLSIHLAANEETEDFLSSDRISTLRSGAVLINTAPNELVDITAIRARCDKGELVFLMDHADELDPKAYAELQQTQNIRIYPPIGYATREATNAKYEILVSNIEQFLKGKKQNVVS